MELLELGGREIAEVAVQALGVVPVHPAQGGQLDLLDGLPRPGVGGAADQLGLVVAIDSLGQRVDAPMVVKLLILMFEREL